MLTLVALHGCARLFGDSEGIKEEPWEDVIMAMKVKAALIETSQLSAAAIEVEASNGRIRLSGFVESASQRQLAIDNQKKIREAESEA
jgi:osmotically-inducible protein OsmY